MIEEDETTLDSISNHQSHYQTQPVPDPKNVPALDEQMERLKMELLSKNNEIVNITNILSNERKTFDDLKKR